MTYLCHSHFDPYLQPSRTGLLAGQIFPAFRFHTYRTVFEPFHCDQKARCQTYRTLSTRCMKVSYKFDIEPLGQNEIARKLSYNLGYKYDIEKQEKFLTSKVSYKFDSPVITTIFYIGSNMDY